MKDFDLTTLRLFVAVCEAKSIKRVADLFARGVAVSGTITDLMIAKDRGRLVFEFEAPGTRVRTWMPIHKTRDVLSLARGDRVDVLYDASAPRRAIVRTLFVARRGRG